MTFGQPRVGNRAFSVYYNEYVPLTIRVTHEHDIVPHLPPYYPFSGKTYHHFATEVFQRSSLVSEVMHVDKKEDCRSRLTPISIYN